MQLRFSFKHMKSSNAVRELAEKKILSKVERYSTKPIEVAVTFSVEKHQHTINCVVKGGDGFNFQVSATSEDMYGSVDLMADKLEIQLRRQKEKVKKHKSKDNLRHLPHVTPKSKDDCDHVPVDAGDLLKYEEARSKLWKKRA